MRRWMGFIGLLLMVSCVSVPKAAPELSQQLGKQLHALETAHIALVHRFFTDERQRIHRFVEQEWMPLFAANFFDQPAIAQAWTKTVQADQPVARLEFIKRVYPEIQDQVTKKYNELSQPLNQLEQQLIQSIRKKYITAKTINRSLTAYLSSASRSSANRWKYLRKIGVEQEGVDAVIDQVAGFSNQALQSAEELKKIEAQFNAYQAQLQRLLSNF